MGRLREVASLPLNFYDCCVQQGVDCSLKAPFESSLGFLALDFCARLVYPSGAPNSSGRVQVLSHLSYSHGFDRSFAVGQMNRFPLGT